MNRAMTVGYIFDDVLFKFRDFFRPSHYLYTDSLLEELVFCLKPRVFKPYTDS